MSYFQEWVFLYVHARASHFPTQWAIAYTATKAGVVRRWEFFELVAALFEAIVAAIIGVIEAIAGLFTVGAEAMGAGEAIIVFVLLVAELILWFFVFIFELIMALVQSRKPRSVNKPIIWRKQKKKIQAIENPHNKNKH